ncbi:MAG: hypothetical protein J0I91_06845, partial [Candidatus Accumulibacter sp.]|nr:hypothetical protein [Accumulibacter sp.]
ANFVAAHRAPPPGGALVAEHAHADLATAGRRRTRKTGRGGRGRLRSGGGFSSIGFFTVRTT